jgi:hypothetical protein
MSRTLPSGESRRYRYARFPGVEMTAVAVIGKAAIDQQQTLKVLTESSKAVVGRSHERLHGQVTNGA